MILFTLLALGAIATCTGKGISGWTQVGGNGQDTHSVFTTNPKGSSDTLYVSESRQPYYLNVLALSDNAGNFYQISGNNVHAASSLNVALWSKNISYFAAANYYTPNTAIVGSVMVLLWNETAVGLDLANKGNVLWHNKNGYTQLAAAGSAVLCTMGSNTGVLVNPKTGNVAKKFALKGTLRNLNGRRRRTIFTNGETATFASTPANNGNTWYWQMFNLKTGMQSWSHTFSGNFGGNVAGFLTDDNLFVVSYYDTIQAIEPSGKILWTADWADVTFGTLAYSQTLKRMFYAYKGLTEYSIKTGKKVRTFAACVDCTTAAIDETRNVLYSNAPPGDFYPRHLTPVYAFNLKTNTLGHQYQVFDEDTSLVTLFSTGTVLVQGGYHPEFKFLSPSLPLPSSPVINQVDSTPAAAVLCWDFPASQQDKVHGPISLPIVNWTLQEEVNKTWTELWTWGVDEARDLNTSCIVVPNNGKQKHRTFRVNAVTNQAGVIGTPKTIAIPPQLPDKLRCPNPAYMNPHQTNIKKAVKNGPYWKVPLVLPPTNYSTTPPPEKYTVVFENTNMNCFVPVNPSSINGEIEIQGYGALPGSYGAHEVTFDIRAQLQIDYDGDGSVDFTGYYPTTPGGDSVDINGHSSHNIQYYYPNDWDFYFHNHVTKNFTGGSLKFTFWVSSYHHSNEPTAFIVARNHETPKVHFNGFAIPSQFNNGFYGKPDPGAVQCPENANCERIYHGDHMYQAYDEGY